MECPVCGKDCVKDAEELIATIPTIFEPCPSCTGRNLNKRLPPDGTYAKPCACGRRFIDEVFAHIWVIMTEEGDRGKKDALASVGMPLIHPGFAMKKAPYLPENSLVLLSRSIQKKTAERIYDEVQEVRGVVGDNGCVPGISDIDRDGKPDCYELLAGCDVRANIFTTQNKPIVVYKQQTQIHIEFPRGYDPKVINVGVQVQQHNPKMFVDACSGAGTLGLVAAMYGIPHVIMNDAWWAAAFWSGYNLKVNRKSLAIENVSLIATYDQMRERPVSLQPLLVAETIGGTQEIKVYQGDFRRLHEVLKGKVDLAVIDLYEKRDQNLTEKTLADWKAFVGGEVFIP